ncbi:MAG: trypsin-like peptidase domain-containing protein [Catenulispora sp.]|nr:trypsin-like peptidase domain-containing protein [Catenulispora sp.]
MAVTLSPADFTRLAGIISVLPEFRTVQGRVDFLTDVFAGSPRSRDLAARLNLDGPPRGVAVRVVDFLQGFGQDEPGRETLAVLINKALAYLGGGPDADCLRSLLAAYPFTTPPTADRPLSRWLGGVPDDLIDEKIIGENTLRFIAVLEIALESAKAVVRIRTPRGLGTGFLAAPGLLVTNNHVVGDHVAAEASEFQFDYQLDRHGVALPPRVRRFAVGGLFHTSAALDYTVLELEEAADGPDPIPLALTPVRVAPGSRVAIIQHPGGGFKKISMQNNFVAYADGRVVQYTTSTEPGSSGSPVFDDDFGVVAVHHSGGLLAEPATGDRHLRNEGTSAAAVLADLRADAPGIAERLTSWTA